MQKKTIRICSLFIILSMAFTPIFAITQKKTKSYKKRSHSKTRVAKVRKPLKAVEPSENLEMTAYTDSKTFSPKFEIANEDQTNKFPVIQDLLADATADVSVSMDILKKRMLEQKEMRELSSRLGVSITNPSLISFYREAADWLGTRYRRGGMNRSGVDCSGFTNIIYNTVFNKKLDRVSTTIAQNVRESVSKEDLQPGDMVFFSTFKKKYINHVGVYLGDGLFIHASIKKGVTVSSLSDGYYSSAWRKGGRN